MEIRYFSDLHLEFIKPNKIAKFIQKIVPDINSICICAGDIGNPYTNNYKVFMDFMNANFKKTFVIAGNHEYYGKKTIEETNAYLIEFFKKYDNISFLNNSYENYLNYCFIGTTLWTKITNPHFKNNDGEYIPNFDHIKCNDLHEISVDFLEKTIKNNDNVIVITHHVPSNSLIDEKYKTQEMTPYNQWYYCDLDKLIENNCDKIKCWFYGHTHMPSHKLINNIPFVCNPLGYPNENVSIDLQKKIDL
jgi:predicted phosphohydrolase